MTAAPAPANRNSSVPAPLKFPSISAADFQHPRDRAATAILKQLVPIEIVLRQVDDCS